MSFVDFAMPFGKDKGKTITEICRTDPAYVRFLHDKEVLRSSYPSYHSLVREIVMEANADKFRRNYRNVMAELRAAGICGVNDSR